MRGPDQYDPRAPDWKLLLSYLSPHQRKTLREHKFFYVRAKQGKIYALPGDGVFVAIDKKGRPGAVHGAHLVDSMGHGYSVADNLLALLLGLTTHPKRLLDLACVNESSFYNEALSSGKYFKGFERECSKSKRS